MRCGVEGEEEEMGMERALVIIERGRDGRGGEVGIGGGEAEAHRVRIGAHGSAPTHGTPRSKYSYIKSPFYYY